MSKYQVYKATSFIFKISAGPRILFIITEIRGYGSVSIFFSKITATSGLWQVDTGSSKFFKGPINIYGNTGPGNLQLDIGLF